MERDKHNNGDDNDRGEGSWDRREQEDSVEILCSRGTAKEKQA